MAKAQASVALKFSHYIPSSFFILHSSFFFHISLTCSQRHRRSHPPPLPPRRPLLLFPLQISSSSSFFRFWSEMKSMAVPDERDDLDLDLALSIGGTFRNLPAKLTSTASGSSFDEDTDAKNRAHIGQGEAKRKRNEEDDERNPPLKREKKLLQDVGSECNVQMPYPYPYSSLQYVPFINGYAFPCMIPYWAAVGHAGERTLHQPMACRSFRPFETNRSGSDVEFSNGCQLEQSGNKNRKTGSSGSSPVCSSSVISDNYQSSSSHEGGGSSYTRSNSCNSSSDRHQMLYPNPIDSMNCGKPRPCSENRTQCQEKFVESHVSKICFESNKDEVVVPSSKPVLNPLKSSMKNVKMENGKPPKPQIQSRNVPSLEQMPCVSTTGVGPNGRTITGFLYRYSNLEVSILCACHGESFSPAEFVKHAGGREISHPMRHITVLPTR